VKSQNIPYLPAVDHVRAFASILIVLYHGYHFIGQHLRFGPGLFDHGRWARAGNPAEAVIVEGHTAVAMFIVLSGFIFTQATAGRTIRYGDFLINRLLRIYPLYLFLIVVGLGAFPKAMSLTELLQTVLGFANHPGALSLGPFSALFWTVAIETQFYLLFPFLLAFVNRSGARPLLWIGLAAILFRTLSAAIGGDIVLQGSRSMAGRIDQFLLGMLVALWFRSSYYRPRVLEWAFVPACLLAAGLLWVLNIDGGWPAQRSWKVLWPTLEGGVWALFLISYLALAERIPARVSKALAAIGVVSYSTYLTHFLLVRLVLRHGWIVRFEGDAYTSALWNSALLLLPASLLVAAVSYHAIERPFLNLRRRYLEETARPQPRGGPAAAS
jgi:peptidoglycan/LPS O-acetylase OafA/YrhL